MTSRVGDIVRAERAAPAKGSWKRYAGRVGVVVSHSGREIGVSWSIDSADLTKTRADSWFLASELVVLSAVPPQRRPRRAQSDANASEASGQPTPTLDTSGANL